MPSTSERDGHKPIGMAPNHIHFSLLQITSNQLLVFVMSQEHKNQVNMEHFVSQSLVHLVSGQERRRRKKLKEKQLDQRRDRETERECVSSEANYLHRNRDSFVHILRIQVVHLSPQSGRQRECDLKTVISQYL